MCCYLFLFSNVLVLLLGIVLFVVLIYFSWCGKSVLLLLYVRVMEVSGGCCWLWNFSCLVVGLVLLLLWLIFWFVFDLVEFVL